MATQALSSGPRASALTLRSLASYPRMRVLAWNADVLYASHGYTLLKARPTSAGPLQWQQVATAHTEWWRTLTCRNNLSARLVRDGFHALAVHPSRNLVAALPGAIVTLVEGDDRFRISHQIVRGTRPLHITSTPDGGIYWGEYFDNRSRNEVHIYISEDGGLKWQIAYTFPAGSIRHVHNILYDRWQKCLWVFTGDYGSECKILRTSLDFRCVDEVVSGNQQARAVAAVVDAGGLFFASDTPLQQNYIYRLDRNGRTDICSPIPSSSICGCRNLNGIFFSTMVEPSGVNHSRDVVLFGSSDGSRWDTVRKWRKDRWPYRLFQYGNAFLPDGENSTDLLAVTTVAVQNADRQTSLWQVSAS